MSFSALKTVVIIPNYNHHEGIVSVVAGVRENNLPIIIVDDGSSEQTQGVNRSLVDGENIQLITLAENQGKGAAFHEGVKLAASQGFTHVIQIDADNQHNTDDIPEILKLVEDNPRAVINGAPLYGPDAPKRRVYGRLISLFWVRVDGLSLQPKDALCGYRAYPVDALVKVYEKYLIDPRMSFDGNILVVLLWLGLPVINFETKVIYNDDGLSHFRLVADNVAITKMFARLWIGSLFRLPWICMNRLRYQK